MTIKQGMGLLRAARLTRRQLIGFALVSAAINGVVTATVGAWLAQTYSQYQSRRQSVESIGNLFYARRTRAGMVNSSLRRNAQLDEVLQRKRAYDESYVEWNTNIRRNLFVIREVMGQANFAKLEQRFEDDVVGSLADIDRCLTKAYDERIAGRDPQPVLAACRMPELYQFALDCGATFTNELFKLSKLSFNPLTSAAQERADAEGRISRGCTRPVLPDATTAPTSEKAPASVTPPTAPLGATSPAPSPPVEPSTAAPAAPGASTPASASPPY